MGVQVNFVEVGLHDGTAWSAVFNGINQTSTNPSMTFYVAPFTTYNYSISIPYGYTPHTLLSGSITPQDLCPGAYYVVAEFSGTLNHITVSPNNATVAGGSTTFSVEGFDAFGDDLGPVEPWLTVSSGSGGSVNGNSVSATVAGSWIVTASYFNGISVSVPLTVSAGPLDHVVVASSNSTIVAGCSTAFSAEGFDAYGNDLGMVDASFSIAPEAAGTVNGNLISATKTGSWMVTASFPGVNNVSVSLWVIASPLDHIVVDNSTSTIVAGNPSFFWAEGFDSFGNDVGPVAANFSILYAAYGSVKGNSVSATKTGTWSITASFPGVADAAATFLVVPASLVHISISSSTSTIVAGGFLTFSVEGFDVYGNSLGPIAATLSVATGSGGSVSGSSVSATNVGSWGVTASFPGVSDVSSTLSVEAGSLDHMRVSSVSGGIVAGGTETFSAEGFDRFGNDLGPISATYSIESASGGSVNGDLVTVTKAGVWGITATFPGIGQVTTVLLVAAGPLNYIHASSASGAIVAGSSETFSTEGFDSFGNDLGPVAATYSLPSGSGGSVVGSLVSATKAGCWTITASFPGIGDFSLVLSINPGSLNHIQVNPVAGAIAAGTLQDFSTEGFDSFGNDLGPIAATYSIASESGASFSGSSVSATKAGTWKVTVSFPGVSDVTTALPVVAGSLDHISVSSPVGGIVAGGSVTASYPGAKGVTTTLPVAAGSLDHISVSSTSAAGKIVAGDSESFSAEGFDSFGNDLGPVVANYSVEAGSGGTVNGSSVSATKAGSWAVTASVAKASASTSLKLNPGAAQTFTVSSTPPKSGSGQSTFTVTAEDAYGNVATDYAGNVKITSNDSSGNLPTEVNLTNGVGNFTANIKTPYAQSITATDIGSNSITGSLDGIKATNSNSAIPEKSMLGVNSSILSSFVVMLAVFVFLPLAVRYRKIIFARSPKILAPNIIPGNVTLQINNKSEICPSEENLDSEITSGTSTRKSGINRNRSLQNSRLNQRIKKEQNSGSFYFKDVKWTNWCSKNCSLNSHVSSRILC